MNSAIDLLSNQPFLTVVVMGLICTTSRALGASDMPLAAAVKTMYVDISACFTGYVLLDSVTLGGVNPVPGALVVPRTGNSLLLLGAIALLLLVVAVAKQRSGDPQAKLRSDALINVVLIVGIAIFFFTQKSASSAGLSDKALWALQEYCRIQATEGSDPLAQATGLTAYFLEGGAPAGSLEPAFAGRWRKNPALTQRPEAGRWRAERREENLRQQVVGSKDVCKAVELLAHAGLAKRQ